MIFLILLLILVAVVVYVLGHIRVVSQSQSWVVERLGSYYATWTNGVHFLVPFVDNVVAKNSLKEQVMDFPPQPVITKDNVTIKINTVVYSQVTDSKLTTYGIENPVAALENLTATTLRNIIGDLDLDETLTSRDIINTKMRTILDGATDKWGIKVNRVEVKDITPPAEIQNAMEKQMKAERERRAQVLAAEGNKKAAILQAEGQKESQILQAQADKESAIQVAEGQKQSRILEAEGQAEAIRQVQQATADGLSAISQADVTDQTLTVKGLEAVKQLADGQATKLVIPSELQNIASLGSVFKASVTDDAAKKQDATNEQN